MIEEQIFDNNDLEQILYELEPDFIEDEVKDQLESPFTCSSRNFIDLYMDKYKAYKKQCDDNIEFLQDLKTQKDETMTSVIKMIEEGFEFRIDREDLKLSSTAKVLYEFFIFYRKDNIVNFLFQFIKKHNKEIIKEIKDNNNKLKDKKDKFSKANKQLGEYSILLYNIEEIISNILSYDLDREFLSYLIEYDNDFNNSSINELFNGEEDKVETDVNLYNEYMQPLIDKEDGYTNVHIDLTEKIYSYYSKKCQNNIDIIK